MVQSSSIYGPAVAAFRQVRACREAVLEKLGRAGRKRLIFTSGGTEANNLPFSALWGACEASSSWPLNATEHPGAGRLRAVARNGPRCARASRGQRGRADYEALQKLLNDGAAS